MNRLVLLLVVSAVVPVQGQAGQKKARGYQEAGSYEVMAVRLDWMDRQRDRDVPVKIYAPKSGKGPFPVIIFSHGLGGTCEGYEYLGRHWASHGYVCVHLQHKGSDDAVWKDNPQPLAAMRKAAQDPANAVQRVRDVRFALDQLAEMNRESAIFKGKLDLDQVGMAGHSFGAWTTQAVIGEAFRTAGGKEIATADPRLKAAVIMSPSPPHTKLDLDPDRAFAGITVPCLHLTGTQDNGLGSRRRGRPTGACPMTTSTRLTSTSSVLREGTTWSFPGFEETWGMGQRMHAFTT